MKRLTMFTGPRGEISSKRVFALACFIAGVVCALWKGDPVSTGIFVGAATAALGLSAVTHT